MASRPTVAHLPGPGDLPRFLRSTASSLDTIAPRFGHDGEHDVRDPPDPRCRRIRPPPSAESAPLAARRPMARATRIALFEREVRERLSRAALELVLGRADVISEGQRGVRGGRDAYFGSTMLTIDLPSLELLLRDACDAGTARRLAELLEADADGAARASRRSRRPRRRAWRARRRKTVSTHVAIRAQAAKVFIDIDVEAGF